MTFGGKTKTKSEQARFDRIKGAEEWRVVLENTNFEVSSAGRVRSIDRLIPYLDGRDRPMKGRLRKLVSTTGTGYFHVYLSGKHHYVHRLVAMSFVDGFEAGKIVNHKDGVRTNNRPENLEWVTHRENNIHARDVLKISYTPPAIGGANRLSIAVIADEVGGLGRLEFAAMMDAQRAGFHAAAICRCCRGQQLAHKGYFWRYADG